MMAIANVCPIGNLRACQAYLKKNYRKPEDPRFVEKYNQVCLENKTFSCLKITVRGDMTEAMKEQGANRGPNAQLFHVRIFEENYIYILNSKK